jgi:hypothetical protein
MGDWQGLAVYLIGEDGLRMEGVLEAEAFVEATAVVEGLFELVGATEDEVARLGFQPGLFQQSRELDALPFADAAPALDAVVPGDSPNE